MKTHPDVELPVNSGFRKLLDDIVSEHCWNQNDINYKLRSLFNHFQMDNAYKKVLHKTRNPIGESHDSLDTLNGREESLDNMDSNTGTKLKPSVARKRGKALAGVKRPATSSIPIFVLTDTESEKEPAANVDSDVEILEWIPGTDVKPIIKVEMI